MLLPPALRFPAWSPADDSMWLFERLHHHFLPCASQQDATNCTSGRGDTDVKLKGPAAPCQPSFRQAKRCQRRKRFSICRMDSWINPLSRQSCRNLGFIRHFAFQGSCGDFPPNLQHFAAPYLGFTNGCFYNYIYPSANGFTANDISFWWESFWAEAKSLQAKQILFFYSLISRKLRGQYCAATDRERAASFAQVNFFSPSLPGT